MEEKKENRKKKNVEHDEEMIKIKNSWRKKEEKEKEKVKVEEVKEEKLKDEE